jgi:hypothetical protein
LNRFNSSRTLSCVNPQDADSRSRRSFLCVGGKIKSQEQSADKAKRDEYAKRNADEFFARHYL